MDLDADVAGHQADDPLDVAWRHGDAGVDPPLAQAIEPQAAIWVDHDLDDGGIAERRGDLRAHGRA